LIDLGFLKSAWRYDRKAVVAALREFLDATFPAEGPAEIDAGDRIERVGALKFLSGPKFNGRQAERKSIRCYDQA
jgi:hypothetical protein